MQGGNDIWESFIAEYCKVQILCYEGEPNWLGWIVLAGGALLVGLFGLVVLGNVLESFRESRRGRRARRRLHRHEEPEAEPATRISRSASLAMIVLVLAIPFVIILFGRLMGMLGG